MTIPSKGLLGSQSEACACTVAPAGTLHSTPRESNVCMHGVQPSFPSQNLSVTTTAAKHLVEKQENHTGSSSGFISLKE